MTLAEALSPVHRPYAWWGAGFGIVMVILVLVLGATGALGPFNDCLRGMEENCYCENVDKTAVQAALDRGQTINDAYIKRVVLQTDSFIRQPVSTWSNLSAVFLGVLLLWGLGTGIRSSDDAGIPNPMAAPTKRSIGYGLVLIFMGPGSMLLHVSLTKYGGWGDNLSMNFFITYALLHNLFRVFKWSDDNWFFAVWAMINVTLGVLVFPDVIPGAGIGKLVFGIHVSLVILLELALSCHHWPLIGVFRKYTSHIRRPLGFVAFERTGVRFTWFFGGLMCFGGAFLIWNLSGDGAPLCDPETLLQGHGLWHVLSYASIVCFFMHFRAENASGEAA